MQSILLYSMVLSQWVRRSTYMRRDAGEEGGREFSSKMPRTMSNLPDFPRRSFLYAYLCVYTKSMLHPLYIFCAISSWSILHPILYITNYSTVSSDYIDLKVVSRYI